MSDDYRDMLCALKNANAEFLVVGAHAVGAHGIIRGTLDFDIWVRPTPENAERVWAALLDFRAPLGDVQPADFVNPDLIFQIGVTPNRIDIVTRISGVNFDEAWESRIEADVLGIKSPVIGREHLIRNKRAVARPKDISDADDLENGRCR